MQGQGFENVGDETLFWYAQWSEQKSDGMRLAVWPRARRDLRSPGTNQVSAILVRLDVTRIAEGRWRLPEV